MAASAAFWGPAEGLADADMPAGKGFLSITFSWPGSEPFIFADM